MKFLVASNNAHKHQELREIFAAVDSNDPPVTFIAPRDMGIDIDPDESADSYTGNARLKARAFAQVLWQKTATEMAETWVIADDSGLEVDALNGRPGIYSARYHKQAPGGDGCAELLRELQRVPDDRRTARFQCAIVLIAPDGSEHTFTGTCEGSIAHEQRGVGGFGFDPVFLVSGGWRTMAELSPHEKHRISHRGVAARQVLAFLARSTDPGAGSR